jgi:hypothetical protein
MTADAYIFACPGQHVHDSRTNGRVKTDVSNEAVAKEGGSALTGAIKELCRQRHVHGTVILLKRPHGAD